MTMSSRINYRLGLSVVKGHGHEARSSNRASKKDDSRQKRPFSSQKETFPAKLRTHDRQEIKKLNEEQVWLEQARKATKQPSEK